MQYWSIFSALVGTTATEAYMGYTMGKRGTIQAFTTGMALGGKLTASKTKEPIEQLKNGLLTLALFTVFEKDPTLPQMRSTDTVFTYMTNPDNSAALDEFIAQNLETEQQAYEFYVAFEKTCG